MLHPVLKFFANSTALRRVGAANAPAATKARPIH
jgi:hypothetical protein